jgi:predicted hotdog family 3-hydroxylacyl-ACP dehydratase
LLVNEQQITEFIPQKPPFVMVGSLMECNDESCTSQLLIRQENIFCKDGIFSEPGLIENIAQTAALHAGWQAKQQNKEVKKGFIGAVKRLKIHSLPKVNDVLTTRISFLSNVMNASIIKGVTKVKGKVKTECEMTIFTEE